MTPIKRPRHRPRVRSISFRVFGYVLRREAMRQIWRDAFDDRATELERRRLVLWRHPFDCIECSRHRAAERPEARFTL